MRDDGAPDDAVADEAAETTKRGRSGGFLSYERQLRLAFGLGLGIALLYGVLIIENAAALGLLGYDYLAYDLAIDRLLAGQPIYDATATEFGPFGLYFYPPPFLLLVLPIALLPQDLAIWAFTGLLAAASVVAILILPVSTRTRWWMALLAALSWPLLYTIKLGQVGPIILLLFALGWRWLDRAWPLGVSMGLGAVIKLQPALLIGWAAVTGRRRAAAIAIGVFVILGVLATVVAGPASWVDNLSLLGRVSRPIETPHAFGVGRLAFEAGATTEVATLVHYANLALVAAVTLYTVFRGSAVASYLAVAVASQFLSPVLWDHYALVLLLPTAWLLDRGRLWAAVIPVLTSTPLVLLEIQAPWLYPIAFWLALLGVAWEGIRDREASVTAGAEPSPVGSAAG
jgi:alpha-1,2-mannosyltransferase